MQKIRKTLTAEQYDMLCKMNKEEQEDWLFPAGIPMAWTCGYGYYGHKLVTDGQEFWVEFSIGESCD